MARSRYPITAVDRLALRGSVRVHRWGATESRMEPLTAFLPTAAVCQVRHSTCPPAADHLGARAMTTSSGTGEPQATQHVGLADFPRRGVDQQGKGHRRVFAGEFHRNGHGAVACLVRPLGHRAGPGGRHPQPSGDQASVGARRDLQRLGPGGRAAVQPLDHGCERPAKRRVLSRREREREGLDARRALRVELDRRRDRAPLAGEPPPAVRRGVGLRRPVRIDGKRADPAPQQR